MDSFPIFGLKTERLRILFHIILLVGGHGLALAQSVPVDTTAELPAAWVWGNRLEVFGNGSRQWNLPADTASALGFMPLSELLPQTAPVYIRSYGPGQLASLSLRGAGAAHTALIWNGFNLQNPMHGQVDFSLIPAPLFSGLRIDLGANSALWGSGAIGGAIHLDAGPPIWNKGHTLQAGLQLGQYGRQAQQLCHSWSGKALGVRTRLFRTTQENDFPISGLNGQTRNNSHAAFRQWGALQDWQFRHRRHLFEAHFWLQSSNRQIPPTLLQAQSLATQDDQAFRTALHWQWVQGDWVVHLRSAWLSDLIRYADPAAGLDDRSLSNVAYAEAEGQWAPRRGHLFSMGIHQALLKGKTDYYPNLPWQSRTAILGSYRIEKPGTGWQAALSLRQEWTPDQPAPFTPTLMAAWEPAPWLKTKTQISRHFRWPTLNDQFWSPGGNPGLKPEQGWGAEWGLSGKHHHGQLDWSLSAYTRRIAEWILWRPDGAFWSPQNLALVWSRGLEADWQMKHTWGPIHLDYHLAYAWVRSTSQKALGPNDDSFGRQLIYTPEHTATAKATARWQNLSLSWQQRYTGKVYTLADHSDALPGFGISNVQFEGWWKWKDLKILFFSNLYNIFNTDYQIVQHRPMPGRWLETGLSFSWDLPKKRDAQ